MNEYSVFFRAYPYCSPVSAAGNFPVLKTKEAKPLIPFSYPFCILPTNELWGFDIDDVAPDSEKEDWILNQTPNTYLEHSRSMTGYHLLATCPMHTMPQVPSFVELKHNSWLTITGYVCGDRKYINSWSEGNGGELMYNRGKSLQTRAGSVTLARQLSKNSIRFYIDQLLHYVLKLNIQIYPALRLVMWHIVEDGFALDDDSYEQLLESVQYSAHPNRARLDNYKETYLDAV